MNSTVHASNKVGGLHLDALTISSVNGNCFNVFFPEEEVIIKYEGEGYISTYYPTDNPGIIMRLQPKSRIRRSVGLNGYNDSKDFQVVREALYRRGLLSEKSNSQKEINNAIIEFQKSIQHPNPDGKIDVNGTTIRALFPRFVFVANVRSFKEGYFGQTSFSGVDNFRIPPGLGEYDIYYNKHYLFSSVKDDPTDMRGINYTKNALPYYPQYNEIKITNFIIKNDLNTERDCIKARLRLNGDMPYMNETPMESIQNSGKCDVSWIIEDKNRFDKLLFQYRLYPLFDEWSAWTKFTNVEFSVLPRGINVFELRGKFNGKAEIYDLSTIQFKLSDNFISSENIYKGFEKTGDGKIIYVDQDNVEKYADNSSVLLDNVYKSSVAILISTGKEYKNFTPLPYVENDINELEKTLKIKGFKVIKMNAKSSNDFEEKLNSILRSDTNLYQGRLLIYITSHGTIVENKYYLATENCDKESPFSTCIDFEYLLDRIGYIDNPKHKLLIIDACYSGVGLTYKSSVPQIARNLIKYEGFSVISAGMSNQLAEMSPKRKMSLLAFYLNEGLKGKADFSFDGEKDQIITLSELILYLQQNVNREAKKSQLPLLGRISGEGEIIFKSNN